MQFSLRTMMLATAFIAVCIASIMAIPAVVFFCRPTLAPYITIEIAAHSVPYCGAFWVPIIVAAFAIGRRSLTFKTILALAIAELLALGMLAAYLLRW